VTDPPGAPVGITVQLGFGPLMSNPEYEAGWSFVDAVYDHQIGNNDQYSMVIFPTPPFPGIFAYVYRMSMDAGATWTYCDCDGAGSNPGLTFDLGSMGVLIITPP